MENIVLVEVASGAVQNAPTWEDVYVNKDGYLFVLDKDENEVVVQLIENSSYAAES